MHPTLTPHCPPWPLHPPQAVWSVAYHHMGDVCASASLDHTVRLWDVPAGKCRMALRGHVDSVNQVCGCACVCDACVCDACGLGDVLNA